jgi:hypothetical protein
VASSHRVSPRTGRIGRLESAEGWGFPVVDRERPRTSALLTIAGRGAGVCDVYLLVGTWSHTLVGLDLASFSDLWADRLSQLGELMYPRATGPDFLAEAAFPHHDPSDLVWA